MSFHRIKYFFFLFVIEIVVSLIGFCILPGQSKLKLQFMNEPARSTEVESYRKTGTYVSVNSLTNALKIGGTYLRTTKQMEFKSGEFSVKLTANNPFVYITDSKRTTNVVQLPFNIENTNTQFFAPLESFIKVLDDILPENIGYDKTRFAITVSRNVAKPKFDITGVTIEQKANGYLLKILSSRKLHDYESWVKSVDKDSWLYVTLPDAKADVQSLTAGKPGGVVKDLLVFQSATSVQLTVKLGIKVSSTELLPSESGNDVLVAIHTPKEEANIVAKPNRVEETLERTRNKWKLDCIVIDAGHGGKDPGTIGTAKTKEKDVTLGVALKLGKAIEQSLPDVKVVYTRKTDEFIELYRRGQIANSAGGKLFISIHCNSTARKPSNANGFEIYLLRPGKTENAVRIAARENEVVKLEKDYQNRYQELTDEQFILVTMAQSAYVKYSEQFAGILQQDMGKNLSIDNHGLKQAGFLVLVGASMPNVLIETGYLSNKKEEKFLRSASGQQQLADAIAKAIQRYKIQYEKSLDEGGSTNETNK